MKIFRSIDEVKNIGQTAVALGNFDGVHIGHQALIGACIQKAKQQALVPSVFTFSNHPSNVIAGKPVIRNIITFEEKAHILDRMGVEYLFSFEFNQAMRTQTPPEFCRDLLFDSLRMREAFCGFNYRFGYRASGTPDILQAMGQSLGYGVTVLSPVDIDGEVVSSTSIRAAVERGDMEHYTRFTGRCYAISGHVIEGRRFGRTIGFPTINLALDLSMVLPLSGVYLSRTKTGGQWHDSITNVGKKPTVGHFLKNAETHIFDFDRDIYGTDVRVEFISLLREEQTFSSIEDLSAQIDADCELARRIHRERAVYKQAPLC